MKTLTGKIEGIKFQAVEVTFDQTVEHGEIDLGSITLASGKRTFVLDVVRSDWYDEEGTEPTSIICTLCVGIDGCELSECESNFDITKEDFEKGNVIGVMFIGSESETEVVPTSITLHYSLDGEDKTLELKPE